MRRLILLRHAKAALVAGGGDRDRPLTAKGREQAQLMGHYMRSEGLYPDIAASSDARRARETMDIALANAESTAGRLIERRIYEASADQLLLLLRETQDSTQTLMAIGHNPGLSEFVQLIVFEGDPPNLETMALHFPPGGMAVLDFDIQHWRDANWRMARLERFITPAFLGGAKELE